MVSEKQDQQADGQLGTVACRLTRDRELQQDLVQEMALHLARMRHALPGQMETWYLKSCEFQARNYLRRGRAGDSCKWARNAIWLDTAAGPNGSRFGAEDVGSLDPVAEMITDELVALALPRFTERQRQVFSLLTNGCGVREAGRQLGISHPAVIKHRKKIARMFHSLRHDAATRRPVAVAAESDAAVAAAGSAAR